MEILKTVFSALGMLSGDAAKAAALAHPGRPDHARSTRSSTRTRSTCERPANHPLRPRRRAGRRRARRPLALRPRPLGARRLRRGRRRDPGRAPADGARVHRRQVCDRAELAAVRARRSRKRPSPSARPSTCDLENAGGSPLGVVHRHLPDFTLRLVNTDGNHPARLSWTRFAADDDHDDATYELVLMGLPVQLEPPADLLWAPDDAPPPGPTGVRRHAAGLAGDPARARKRRPARPPRSGAS